MNTTNKGPTMTTYNNRPLFPIVADIIALRDKANSSTNHFRTRDRARKQLAAAMDALSAEGYRQLAKQLEFTKR